MGLIPLTEGGSIDLDDSTLHEGVGTDELVVRRIVDLIETLSLSCALPMIPRTHNSENPGLACRVLAGPGEVTSLQTKGTELQVSSTDTDGVDALGAELGVGGLAAELELSLLAVVGALRTRGRTLVPGGTGDT